MTSVKLALNNKRNIQPLFLPHTHLSTRRFVIKTYAVFSTFYSFIRLFTNKRIEYEVGTNKIRALFVDTDKGTLIRLFNYSQLKTKQGEVSNKTTPLRVFMCNDLYRISVEE